MAENSNEPYLDRARAIAEEGLILRTTVGSVVHGLSNPGTDDRAVPLDGVLARLDEVTERLERTTAQADVPDEPDTGVIDGYLVETYRSAWG